MAEPTGSTTTAVEDNADYGEFADDELGADAPSEYTTESPRTPRGGPPRGVRW